MTSFLAGCGTEEATSSQNAPPGATSGQANVSKSTTPKAPIPKNVNPDAGNRGIKGKYAD
jgi:hypothetical protein